MLVAILKEARQDETRVALTPDAVKALAGKGFSVAVESGAGLQSGASDADYQAAGASISTIARNFWPPPMWFPWSTRCPPRTRRS